MRSRVELAAEYELSMGTFERTLAGLNVLSNLPFMMFSYPLYQLIKRYKDEDTADDWMNSYVFLGSLAGWGKDWKTDYDDVPDTNILHPRQQHLALSFTPYVGYFRKL